MVLLALGNARFSHDTSLFATVQRLLAEFPDGWTDKEPRGLFQITSRGDFSVRSSALRMGSKAMSNSHKVQIPRTTGLGRAASE